MSFNTEKGASVLKDIRKRYPDALQDRAKLKALLHDYMPGLTMESNILLMAFDEGIIQACQSHERVDQFALGAFSKLLVAHYGIQQDYAASTIAVICECYGLPVPSFLEPKEEPLQKQTPNPSIKWVDSPDDGSFEYEYVNDGILITKFIGFDEEEIVIPNMINGNKVVELGHHAFSKCISIKKIKVPDGITKIGDYCFDECSSLESIVLPDTLKYIGNYAFHYTALKGKVIPKNVISIGDHCFEKCLIGSVTLPKSITKIGQYAFSQCENLKKVVLPQNLTTLECGIFKNCSALCNVTLPKDLVSIEEDAFRNCAIREIHLNEGIRSIGECALSCKIVKNNWEYESVTLSVHIPSSVTTISANAFGYHFIGTIYCDVGSYALQYARANKYKCAKA